MATKSALSVYKGLLRELSINNSKFSYRSLPVYLKIKDEYRRHRPITAKHCKPNDEILFVASTYLSYLESARKRKIIQSIYSKGERSVQQAANIVGLALPEIIDRPYLPIDQRSQQ
ncbi:unnamed protein product [Rotaria socialis]|uniref:Protein FMC1 homolog n=1 Tax=Rotaria socialis TaxID=392032 RepID=A0A819AYH5_9BILA|nr:unnamed protein product [Rotaria socialis]CAF3235364.1 unnamed protein product [Rotaria socialis]CAF3327664.1 unnamed protein product [Rotaria socialis]CAF3406691.1 unnamed protein product [Rotaria socialis]CAF3785034.1 unnamed protein product [Rotaria socialis]